MKFLFGLFITVILTEIENVNCQCFRTPDQCHSWGDRGGCCAPYRCIKDKCQVLRCASPLKKKWEDYEMKIIDRGCNYEKNNRKRAEESRKQNWKRCLAYIKGGRGAGVIAQPERFCKDFDFTMNEVYGIKAEDGGNIKFPYAVFHKTYWQNVWGRIKNIGGQFKSYYDQLAEGDLRALLDIFDDISDPSSFVSKLSDEGTFVGKAKDGVEKLAQLYQKRKG